MSDLLAAFDRADDVFGLLVARPDYLAEVLTHPGMAFVDPATVDRLRQLQAAQRDAAAAGVDLEVFVLDADGVTAYGWQR